ncbi:MAG: FecR domain-containing protein [Acidobacteria bacterium]|nr:FecR domain-containing protein [Acidobacteriota bacterium]
MRRTVWRLFLSTLLATQLAAGGGIALPGGVPVIGQVIISSNAAVGDVVLPGEGTLLENDLVSTGKDGRAVVDFPEKVRAAVGEETKVRFRNTAGRLVAALDSGTVITLKQEKADLRVETPKYSVEPIGRGRAIYVVALLPDRSTTVAARFGNVLITEKASGLRYELREGSYASISAAATGVPGAPGQEKEASKPAPEQPPTPASAPPPKPPWHIGTMSPGASAAVIAAVAGGAIAGAAAAFAGGGGEGGTVSPTR